MLIADEKHAREAARICGAAAPKASLMAFGNKRKHTCESEG